MKTAIERMFDWLLTESGADNCQRCAYCAGERDAAAIAEYGCPYAKEPKGCYYCMVAYFEEHPEA